MRAFVLGLSLRFAFCGRRWRLMMFGFLSGLQLLLLLPLFRLQRLQLLLLLLLELLLFDSIGLSLLKL